MSMTEQSDSAAAEVLAVGVELKVTLSGSAAKEAIESFGLQRGDAKRQRVWFFDAVDAVDPATRDLRLLSAGVVLRLRCKKERKWTSTLKLRPADAARLTHDFRPGSGVFGDDYKVEYDWAEKRVLAASMDADVDEDTVEALLAQPDRIAELYSEDQRRLLVEAGTPPADPLAGLLCAGPIEALRWDEVGVETLPGLRAEHWAYGEGKTFLELSLRAPDFDEAESRRDDLVAELAKRHLTPDVLATSKTETVLRDLLGVPKP